LHGSGEGDDVFGDVGERLGEALQGYWTPASRKTGVKRAMLSWLAASGLRVRPAIAKAEAGAGE
jgi:hypothetical protein